MTHVPTPSTLATAVGAIALAVAAVPVQARDFDAAQAELGTLPAPDTVESFRASFAAMIGERFGGLTRAQVRAEYIRARDAGELDFAYIEVYQIPLLPRGVVEPKPMQMASL